MDSNEFDRKFKDNLKSLNEKQIVQFAWLCGIRSLPLLGAEGNFNFWKREMRLKYLYDVFYALDINIIYFVDSVYGLNRSYASDSTSASYVTRDVAEARDAAYTAAKGKPVYTVAVYALWNAFAAAYAAAYATYVYTPKDITSFAFAVNYKVDMQSIILKDIDLLRKHDAKEISINIESEAWNNFKKALEAEGCRYWARLYENIFKNGIEEAIEGVERRINVPVKVREQGAAAVGDYLERLEKEGAERLNEARIIILGEKGAGKTCLARRLRDINAPMTTESESTAGVDTNIWVKDNINIHIWDFAGHTVTHAVHQFFLSERCLYLIVFDGRTEERNRMVYWLNYMKNYGGDSKAIILVNRRDKHKIEIPINSLKELYSIVGLYEFSIQDDIDELEKFRTIVSNYIQNNPSWDKQLIPSSYYKVKKDLEKRFVKGNNSNCEEHITKQEFCAIAERYSVVKIEELLTNLNALGISLWYPKMNEFNTLVLNPEWISNGVYRIINWASNEKKHQVLIDDFAKVFAKDSERYPVDKYEFFFRLMEHYELAYKTSNGKCLIIPHLLKEDRPETLTDFPMGESLMLRYKVEQTLPPNIISRFIVRHNQEIKKEGRNYIVWRYGVVLNDGKGGEALVREEDRTISISVKGVAKTEYLSVLRETLNEIFNSYKSNKPELQYRVERFGQIPDEVEKQNPLWLPDLKIYNHTKDNIPYYEDLTRQNIDLSKFANIYNITAQTLMIGHGHVYTDSSTHNTFNFNNCSISLQGNLNDLARIVGKKGDGDGAEALEYAAVALEQAENCQTPEEVKKKGLVNGLKRVVQDLGDEDSKLHKTVAGIEKGISIAQDIAKGYNDIAQWLGLPQVPKPFLKKEEKE